MANLQQLTPALQSQADAAKDAGAAAAVAQAVTSLGLQQALGELTEELKLQRVSASATAGALSGAQGTPGKNEKDLESLKKNLDGTATVAVLVATLAFTGILTPPKSLAPVDCPCNVSPPDATTHTAHTPELTVFMCLNVVGFGLAIVAVLLSVLTFPHKSAGITQWFNRWQCIGRLVFASSVLVSAAFLVAASITFDVLHTSMLACTIITGVALLIVSGLVIVPPAKFKKLGLA